MCARLEVAGLLYQMRQRKKINKSDHFKDHPKCFVAENQMSRDRACTGLDATPLLLDCSQTQIKRALLG